MHTTQVPSQLDPEVPDNDDIYLNRITKYRLQKNSIQKTGTSQTGIRKGNKYNNNKRYI
jgi:hypothetical protein